MHDEAQKKGNTSIAKYLDSFLPFNLCQSRTSQDCLQIRLLEVCRQIYIEAIRVLYITSTWSFDRDTGWYNFIRSRNPLQSRLVKKVHLDDNVVYSSFDIRTLTSGFKLDIVCAEISTLWGAHSSKPNPNPKPETSQMLTICQLGHGFQSRR
jgi:hypothetical protein